MCYNVVITPKVYLVPEVKPRDTNVLRVLLLLVNDSPILLLPKAKPRDTNVPSVLLLLVNDSPNLLVFKAKLRNTKNISYYYFYSANVPNHLLIIYIQWTICIFQHFGPNKSNVRSFWV